MKDTIPATNLNPKAPILIKRLEPLNLNDWEEQRTLKYANLNKARDLCISPVKAIIDQMPLVGGFKNALLDVKVIDLEAGSYPCLPGFHLDCTMDPNHPTKPEVHHIFVSGCDCRTRFVVSPVSICVINNRLINVDQAIENQQPDIMEIEENTIYRYTRENLHAPSRARLSGRRILIRVTETDLVTPNPIKRG